MLTSWTFKEHTAKRQPCAAIYGAVYALRLSLSSVINTFSGRLGQETSIDSRHIRH
jgi:hypothetical protein